MIEGLRAIATEEAADILNAGRVVSRFAMVDRDIPDDAVIVADEMRHQTPFPADLVVVPPAGKMIVLEDGVTNLPAFWKHLYLQIMADPVGLAYCADPQAPGVAEALARRALVILQRYSIRHEHVHQWWPKVLLLLETHAHTFPKWARRPRNA